MPESSAPATAVWPAISVFSPGTSIFARSSSMARRLFRTSSSSPFIARDAKAASPSGVAIWRGPLAQ